MGSRTFSFWSSVTEMHFALGGGAVGFGVAFDTGDSEMRSGAGLEPGLRVVRSAGCTLPRDAFGGACLGAGVSRRGRARGSLRWATEAQGEVTSDVRNRCDS